MGSVFVNGTQDRFFHIPHDVELASGPLELRSLKGERRLVDPQAAAEFQVDEARAKELVKDEVAQFTAQAVGGLSAVGQILRAATDKVVPAPAPDQSPPKNIVADLLGITPEQLSSDPDAVRQGMRGILAGLGQALADAKADTPEREQRTHDRVERVREALGSMPAGEGSDAVVAGLQSLAASLSDPDTVARLRQASDALTQATTRLRAQRDQIDAELEEESEG